MPGCDIRSSDKTSLHCTEPCKETSITEAIITIVNVNVISPCTPRVVPNCHGLGIASLCMGTCGRRFRRARFPSNRRFFRRNRRMFGIGLRCNPTSEPSATTTTTETRKQKKSNRLNKQNKNSERAAHRFWQIFLPVFARMTLSNLSGLAIRSSRPRFRRKYPYRGKSKLYDALPAGRGARLGGFRSFLLFLILCGNEGLLFSPSNLCKPQVRFDVNGSIFASKVNHEFYSFIHVIT